MTTGGTVNYVDGFPRSQGSNPAQWRSHLFLDSKTIGGASSLNKVSGRVSVPLLPEIANSYYIIRGFTISALAVAANVFMGAAFETNRGHTVNTGGIDIDDPDGIIFCWGSSRFGGIKSVTFTQPIRLSEGNGLNLECYNLAKPSDDIQGNTVTVFYDLLNN